MFKNNLRWNNQMKFQQMNTLILKNRGYLMVNRKKVNRDSPLLYYALSQMFSSEISVTRLGSLLNLRHYIKNSLVNFKRHLWSFVDSLSTSYHVKAQATILDFQDFHIKENSTFIPNLRQRWFKWSHFIKNELFNWFTKEFISKTKN